MRGSWLLLASALLLVPTLANAESSFPPSGRSEPATSSDDEKKKEEKEQRPRERLKFSGYVQARYVYADHSQPGLVAGQPAVRDGFNVRRGRLKATYDATWSKYVLQIDAVPRGVTLRDTEAWLIEPWTGYGLAAIAGQTKVPFGYEVNESSRDRPFPERSRVVRAFVPGERDRGLKLAGKIEWLVFRAGVFDGNGIDNDGFRATDNDREKDVIGRLGFDLEWISGGVSGWYGKTFSDEAGRHFDRNRLGADVQVELELLPFGSTTLKGEYIWGHTWQRNGVEQFGTPASGWYASLIQRLGERNAIAVRYDYFDPSLGTATAADPSAPTRPASTNPIGTLTFGVFHDWDDSLRLSAFYEVPMTRTAGQAIDPDDNVLTLQAQASF
jgi:hypothetical protein